MDVGSQDEWLTGSLTQWLAPVTFEEKGPNEVTTLLIDSIADWAEHQGWRAYRRAASVLHLPPPLAHQHSWLDLGCARPSGPPLAIEIDRTDRRRTIDKLLAEAEAGRTAIWVRWGARRFTPPPAPVQMVTFVVTNHPGSGDQGPRYSRRLVRQRPAPPHRLSELQVDEQAALFVEDRQP